MTNQNGWRRIWQTVCLLAMGVALSASQGFAAEEPSGKEPTNTVGVLQVGDGVKIILSGISMMEGKAPIEQKIKEDGTISLEHIRSIKAAGLTASQLENAIYTNYVPRIYKRISVTVVTENRFYYVGGIVRRPDRYPYASEITVSKAIDSAGGFTEFSKKNKVQITRLNGTVEIVDCEEALKNTKLDVPIYPGDRIYVDRRVF